MWCLSVSRVAAVCSHNVWNATKIYLLLSVSTCTWDKHNRSVSEHSQSSLVTKLCSLATEREQSSSHQFKVLPGLSLSTRDLIYDILEPSGPHIHKEHSIQILKVGEKIIYIFIFLFYSFSSPYFTVPNHWSQSVSQYPYLLRSDRKYYCGKHQVVVVVVAP